jgi:hypothetical protein
VRGPAGEICIARTRTVSLFISFPASSKAGLPQAFRDLSNRASSFFSIIEADSVFPQMADCVAICALQAEAHAKDSALKIVSAGDIPFPDDSI